LRSPAILAARFGKKNNSDMRLLRRCSRVLPPAKVVLALAAAGLLLASCSAPVGSQEWCGEMRAKPTSEWTADAVRTYVDACVVGPEA
jgi:hypothetical protein